MPGFRVIQLVVMVIATSLVPLMFLHRCDVPGKIQIRAGDNHGQTINENRPDLGSKEPPDDAPSSTDNDDVIYHVQEPYLKQVNDEGQDKSAPYARGDLPARQAKAFKLKITPEDKELLFTLMDKFHNIMAAINGTYFMVFGTLLGSYRHHDVIPWDDDVDILVPAEQERQLVKAVEAGGLLWRLQTGGQKGKISSKQGQPYSTQWTFPFLDVFFYSRNSSHFWAAKHPPTRLDLAFPLTLRPLNGRLYFSPRDPRHYLETVHGFKPHECTTHHFNQKTQLPTPLVQRLSVPCEMLTNNFKFVQHVRRPGGRACVEVAMEGDRVVGSFVRSSAGVPVC